MPPAIGPDGEPREAGGPASPHSLATHAVPILLSHNAQGGAGSALRDLLSAKPEDRVLQRKPGGKYPAFQKAFLIPGALATLVMAGALELDKRGSEVVASRSCCHLAFLIQFRGEPGLHYPDP